ncbi:hypothetical protein CQY20_30195 [Mycolicibacterium agri]|uniref:Beta-xylosidase n=1 Tax=Mycolicibacterium agri TaxID=36811 RepID=A0A2A7MPW6_MYCAG|nr:hypothetical protein [Mycolicibacterium agri]PEG33553.1 hypothetical protein CQY20_30195 [Mycolicibacterium agri]GFG52959.1 hypothetical protein MAGR_44000 [Mycolicibacterium agri]
MAVFDRCNVRVVAVGAGLCGVAIALSPAAAAVPWATGGYECVADKASGTAAAGAPACAPLNDMAGVPMAVPGPLPAAPPAAVPPVPLGPPPIPPVPLGPPPVPAAPLVPPVPVGAPIAAAPVAGGAPLTDMGGSNYGGKGQPTGPLPAGAPAPGQPVPAGPTGAS